MPKTPTNLRALKGFCDNRPRDEGEPVFERKLLPCPAMYHPDSIHAAVWKKLAKIVYDMGVSTEMDELSLQWLVEPVAEYWFAWHQVYVPDVMGGDTTILVYEPYYEKTTQGMNAGGDVLDTCEKKFKPAVRLMENTWKRAQSQMIQFGMTPAARTKVIFASTCLDKAAG